MATGESGSDEVDRRSFPIIGIGASAGGLQAICELIAEIRPDSGMAFLVVQHLDPDRPSLLPEILARHTPLRVLEATEGVPVEMGHLYVIPPGVSMSLVGRRIRLRPRDKSMGPPMPVDDLLDSLAKDQRSQAIGVILSGSGTDGVLGLQAIHDKGGIAFAQDDATAAFSSMPRAAVAQGCVDLVLPPARIGAEIMRIGTHPHLSHFKIEHVGRVDEPSEQNFRPVFVLLRKACNIDFTHYKLGTIHRRLSRRMALRRLTSIADYVAVLRSEPAEVFALGRDLLIRVTEFFRDPESFDALFQRVLPRFLGARGAEEPIRIWVPGCSSGEEVYSIAMCVFEYLSVHGLTTPVRIFGTDISDEALETARTGRYIENIARNVSAERLQRFFVRDGDYYRIDKNIRDVCTFARHNVASDPPFSRMDLISCRNLLIYLDPVLQRTVMPLFHYALRPNGVLMLGPSETVGSFARLFSVIESKRTKLYSKRVVAGEPAAALLSRTPVAARAIRSGRSSENRGVTTQAERLREEAERTALARYAPTFVICDDDFNIVAFRGDTAQYLVNPDGPASSNLRRLARAEVFVQISQAVNESRQTGRQSLKRGVRLEGANGVKVATIEVHPLQLNDVDGRWFLVLFEQSVARHGVLPAILGGPLRAIAAEKSRKFFERFNAGGLNSKNEEIAALRAELESTREQLRTTLEEHESGQEELKSSEEELLSSNEEFQSTNEELETAKEELQSINEELSTTNDELRYRNGELKTLHAAALQERDYADSVIETMSQPMIILESDLRITRVNEAFYQKFRVSPATTIGAKLYALGNGQWGGQSLRTLLEEILPTQAVVRDFTVTHAFPEIGVRTVRVNASRVAWGGRALILLAMDDVTEQTVAMDQLQTADTHKNQFLAMLAHELRNPLAAIRNGLHVWGRKDASPEISQKARATAERQLEHEISLVDDLLDVSRITRGIIPLKITRVDVAEVVRQSVEGLRSEFDLRGHEVVVEVPDDALIVQADAMRIEQVVTNILSNAIKYTPPGGHIVLSAERREQSAVLTVIDNGIGMSAEFLPSIFTIFVQAERSLDRHAGGLGLGLALVHRLVELHQGTIEAFSAGVGKGSRFVVQLPAMPVGTSPDSIEPPVDMHGLIVRPRRIMVIDDNLDAAESMEMCLQLYGHEVKVAIDGASALEVAKTFQPEIMLIDIGLPDLDGFEVARRVRRIPGQSGVLLIALTGYGQEEYRRRSEEAGFDHHVLKPIDLRKLQSLISMFASRAAEDESG